MTDHFLLKDSRCSWHGSLSVGRQPLFMTRITFCWKTAAVHDTGHFLLEDSRCSWHGSLSVGRQPLFTTWITFCWKTVAVHDMDHFLLEDSRCSWHGSLSDGRQSQYLAWSLSQSMTWIIFWWKTAKTLFSFPFSFLTRGACVSCLRACLGVRLLPQSYHYPNSKH